MNARVSHGVWPATLTPLDERGEPCAELLIDHIRQLLNSGCKGIVLLGTTGEANSFTVRERQAILEAVLASDILPSQLMVGTGCCAAGDSLALTTHALSAGVNRVLLLPPFYYKGVRETGVVEAYARVIEALGNPAVRLYLYRIPQVSGVDITPPIIDELVHRYPVQVAGIKDSAGDWASLDALCRRYGERLDVFAGSERFLLQALDAGASGCVTATGNAYAALICNLYAMRAPGAVYGADGAALGIDAAANDAHGAALAAQHRLARLRDVFEQFPIIAALKAFLARHTHDERWRNLRPPLTALSHAEENSLFTQLAAAQDVSVS